MTPSTKLATSRSSAAASPLGHSGRSINARATATPCAVIDAASARTRSSHHTHLDGAHVSPRKRWLTCAPLDADEGGREVVGAAEHGRVTERADGAVLG